SSNAPWPTSAAFFDDGGFMTNGWYVALGATLWACGIPTTKSDTRVLSTAPAPGSTTRALAESFPVTVTELEFHQERTDLQVDRSGRLSSMLPPGHYAFAATMPEGFAYIEQKLDAPARPTISLSPACHRVRGRVNGARAFPATVVLAREAEGNTFT